MAPLLAQKSLGSITGLDSAYTPAADTGAAYLTTAELIISNILTILTVVAGITFVLQFLLGGLNWITAGGAKDKVEKAKGMMTGGAIGLIIVVVSYSVVWIVGQALGFNVLTPAETLGNAIKF